MMATAMLATNKHWQLDAHVGNIIVRQGDGCCMLMNLT